MPDTSAFARQSNSKSGLRKLPPRPSSPQAEQRTGRPNTTSSKPGTYGKSNASGRLSASGKPKDADSHDEILFQSFFKSVGPRTYAAQIKKARNGNHYLVLTEGKRDKQTEELRKIRLFLYSEDFQSFFHLLRETAGWIKAHPLPPDYQQKRSKFWAKKAREELQRQIPKQTSIQTSNQTTNEASSKTSNPHAPPMNPPNATRPQAHTKQQVTSQQYPAPTQSPPRQGPQPLHPQRHSAGQSSQHHTAPREHTCR